MTEKRTEMQQKWLDSRVDREPEETKPEPALGNSGKPDPRVEVKAGDTPTKIRIEPNVPIPAPRNGSRGGRWRRVAETMRDGDSVGKLTHKEADALIKSIKASGRTAVVRKSEEGVCRVWVTE